MLINLHKTSSTTDEKILSGDILNKQRRVFASYSDYETWKAGAEFVDGNYEIQINELITSTIGASTIVDKKVNYAAYTSITMGASGSTFIMPFDGLAVLYSTSSAGGQSNQISIETKPVAQSAISTTTGQPMLVSAEVAKNSTVYYYYQGGSNTLICYPYIYYNLPGTVRFDASYVRKTYTGITGTGFTGGVVKVWDDGWVQESGITTTNNNSVTITLPIVMATNAYFSSYSHDTTTSTTMNYMSMKSKTTTSMIIQDSRVGNAYWEVEGYANSSSLNSFMASH